jgi:Ca2+-transporting ATPase
MHGEQVLTPGSETESSVTDEVAWHATSLPELYAKLQSGSEGLGRAEAENRLSRLGPNALRIAKAPGPLKLLLRQLASPLILMLIAAACISLVGQHFVDAIVIGAVVVLNSVIGVTQEWRAEKALDALRQLSAPHARVLRDGAKITVKASEVVPGDILLLETGDRVAADVRLIASRDLAVDESSLTGESEPIAKSAKELPANTALADRVNMAWSSTNVTGGRARGLVVMTGMRTEVGRIAGDVQATERAVTPLQQRLSKLGGHIGLASIGAATTIFVFGLLRGFSIGDMLLFAVAAAVSAIPEGLPAVISVVLAVGVQRMSKQNAIVRRLPAVETLGSTTVVCTDKTGTLTRNQMTVRRVWTNDHCYTVEGEGFAPEGRLTADDSEPINLEQPSSRSLRTLFEIGALANNAQLLEENGEWTVRGNPTDGALIVVSRKLGIDPELVQSRQRITEIPFSSARKYMATLNQWEGTTRLLVKGAPERLLSASAYLLADDKEIPLTDELRNEIQSMNEQFASDALRVVAGAYRDCSKDAFNASASDAESNLVFVGMWGLLDPPREQVIEAVAKAQRAGMRVVMITGDHATTATAIARNVGIVNDDHQTLSGAELDRISDDVLSERAAHITVFARVAPEHKLRIVQSLQQRGHVVAMTGDGVNDAPALKSADIGIAMGMSGTEVAKEAGDMILTDDNFATIIGAVEEGRVIFSNLRQVVAFLLTTASGEVLTLFAALVLGFQLPVTAVMILWINLVTDGTTTIPLGLEPKHGDVLRRPPRPRDSGVLDRSTIGRIAMLATVSATGTLSLFAWSSQTKDLQHAQTIAFTTLVAFEWFKTLTYRSSTDSLFSVGLFSNHWLVAALGFAMSLHLAAIYTPLGQLAFGTVPLSAWEWLTIGLVASTALVADEVRKFLKRRQAQRHR